MAMQSDYMVTEEASVGYQKRTLIDHVNLHVKKGEILTLIGPNGVGKSTILKSIIRQLSLIAGTVSIDGKEVNAKLRMLSPPRMNSPGEIYLL